MQLSAHFTLDEMTRSDTAKRLNIQNVPNVMQAENLKRTAATMEIVRSLLGNKPIIINSGFRCPELNAAVKGAVTSAHLEGLACDFVCPGFGTPLEIVKHLKKYTSSIHFDQLIQEGTWVHIGTFRIPRMEIKTAHFDAGGNASYTEGA